jgi:hypothetical protein
MILSGQTRSSPRLGLLGVRCFPIFTTNFKLDEILGLHRDYRPHSAVCCDATGHLAGRIHPDELIAVMSSSGGNGERTVVQRAKVQFPRFEMPLDGRVGAIIGGFKLLSRSGISGMDDHIVRQTSGSPERIMPSVGAAVRTFLLSAFAASALLFSTSAAAQTATDTSKIRLDALSFMVGHWRGEMGDSIAEEFWSPPSGDNMMCMFRQVKDGKAVFYEMLLIETTPDGLVMRLKHFNPGLVGWEEKNEVYSYPLASFQKNDAVFERPDKKTRLRYQGTSPDSLVATLVRTVDGKPVAEEFLYARVK